MEAEYLKKCEELDNFKAPENGFIQIEHFEHKKSELNNVTKELSKEMGKAYLLNIECQKLKKELEKKDTSIANFKVIQNDNLEAIKFLQYEKRSEALKMQEMQFEITDLKTENADLVCSGNAKEAAYKSRADNLTQQLA